MACYQPGEKYDAHHDAVDPSRADGKEFVREHGQRVATILMYLNDVDSGGCTKFHKLDLDVHPREGRLLLFYPSNADNATVDERLLHSAEPASSEKWVCQIWVRATRRAR